VQQIQTPPGSRALATLPASGEGLALWLSGLQPYIQR
jgi:hypothetical protein